MDESTQKRAINSLIDLWEDANFVLGKGFQARKLKPYLQATLSEPGSIIHRLIEAAPDLTQWYISNANQPVELRRKAIAQLFVRKEVQKSAWFLIHRMQNLAILYRDEGITAAKAERRITQQYEDALSTIPLKELVKVDDSVAHENEIRNLMARLGLSTGSVAGKDKRLEAVLEEHLQDIHFIGPEADNVTITTYEQDLKAAMWECAMGNRHVKHEMIKMIESAPPRPLEEQMALIVRIFRGQEHKLMRDTLLRILRKTIADLPEIKETARDHKNQYEYQQYVNEKWRRKDDPMGSIYDRNETALDNLPDNSGSEERVDLIQQLKPRELDLFYGELERLRAKSTREQWYGTKKKAQKVTQQMKYLRKKYTPR